MKPTYYDEQLCKISGLEALLLSHRMFGTTNVQYLADLERKIAKLRHRTRLASSTSIPRVKKST